ncbi:tryptophan synthase subunit alpha [Flavobacterium antarcticum]|uniref:tryptophan synthase subunit alpha n=1 Tax=Flavobacterium antarcticum TaxID=271155 RepID=UPI0003B6BB29|nr:tryptophan synthase subunit alpha [Flavobacterium antarcticum]
MNRINQKLQDKENILSIYFSAGYPNLNDTVGIIQKLENSGVDLIEIGLPFSDPLADGPTIQNSATIALQNGMSTEVLFNQLKQIRSTVKIPLIIMGYFNPIIQYGVEQFCHKCAEVGIDGLIIPDLPLEIYVQEYKALFEKYSLINVLLITPQTSEERIKLIDTVSEGFIYTVSSASVTGNSVGFGMEQENYFRRIQSMKLKSPQLIGFGIHDQDTFSQACQYAKGGIVGSAFIKHLEGCGLSEIGNFVKKFKR